MKKLNVPKLNVPKHHIKKDFTGISGMEILYIAILLVVVLFIGYIVYLIMKPSSITDKHGATCLALSREFDKAKVPIESPIRYHMCDTVLAHNLVAHLNADFG